MPSNEVQRNLLPNEPIESFWDALWLELWPFLCFIDFSTFPVSHLDLRWPRLALNWPKLAETSFNLDHIGRKLAQVGPNWSQVGPSWPKLAALVRSDLKMCFKLRQGARFQI